MVSCVVKERNRLVGAGELGGCWRIPLMSIPASKLKICILQYMLITGSGAISSTLIL